jgi:hypothetical protein
VRGEASTPQMGMQRPDVFVIVLDCVSSSALDSLLDDKNQLPNVRFLVNQGVRFENAAATSPWTIPSHASIFTGLYPWNHGLYNHGSEQLSTDHVTVGEALSTAGYRTFSLSANPFVSPVNGLTRGFQTGFNGGWRDLYLRAMARPGRRTDLAKKESAESVGIRSTPRIPRRIRVAIERFPLLFDLSSRLVGKGFPGAEQNKHSATPWIEPELLATLESAASDVPVFGFVNLIDAHEPYVGIDIGKGSIREHVRLLSARQDRDGWLRGKWKPSEESLSTLTELYLDSLRTLDRRLGRIFSVIESCKRWENSLIVVTSDHGQSFSPGGTLYHAIGLDDALIRIPLIVKFPRARFGATRAEGWASLVDLMPTILAETGSPPAARSDGVDLKTLFKNQRRVPAYAMSDGLPGTDARRVPKYRVDALDKFGLLAYTSEGRVEERFGVSTASHLEFPIDQTSPIPSQGGSAGGERSELHRLQTLVYGQVLRGTVSRVDKLASWGYD